MELYQRLKEQFPDSDRPGLRSWHLLDILMIVDIIQHMDQVEFAKALADETRQEIMKFLCCEWLSVNDVVDRLDGRVNQPTVSHHLKKLEEAELVHVRQEGRQRFYSLNQQTMTICCGNLMSRFAPEYADSVIDLRESRKSE